MATAIRTKPKHVRLNGKDFLPRGPVQYELTNIHGRKVSMGDPGPDSHPTNSTITQHSWNGGGQIHTANPASDMMRFDWGTLLTEYDHYLTLPPMTMFYAPVAEATFSMCLGDHPDGDDAKMYFQIADHMYVYEPSTTPDDPSNWGNVTAGITMGGFIARNRGVVYQVINGTASGQRILFVPGGGTGLGWWDGTGTFNTISGSPNVIDCAVWDEKLFILCSDGSLWWADQPTVGPWPGSGSTGWTKSGHVTDGSSPRHLVNYVNKADTETLYVVTSGAVWGLDFTNSRMVKTYFSYPRHPRQGWGATAWRAELWTSVGMGAHRYDLSQVIPSGIDRDQGVPVEYRGYTTDIVGSYNDLFMYIRGTSADETPIVETETLDMDVGDETMYVDSSLASTHNLLVSWNGIGFHYRWAGQGINSGNMFVSQASGEYNLWWCNAGKVYRQKIPIDYFNPVDPPRSGFTWEQKGFLDTPWYNWSWPDQVKVLKRIELGVEHASLTETIEVLYKLDVDNGDNKEDDPTWTKIGETITAPGRYSFALGTDGSRFPNHDLRYFGLPHNRFKLRFRFRRATDEREFVEAKCLVDQLTNPDLVCPPPGTEYDIEFESKRPVLDWWSAVGRRVLNPLRTWRFNLDLTKQDMGNYPGTAADFLQTLATQAEAVQFDIWDESFMVEVVALSGPKDMTSQEFAGFLTVHLLEANDMEIKINPESLVTDLVP